MVNYRIDQLPQLNYVNNMKIDLGDIRVFGPGVLRDDVSCVIFDGDPLIDLTHDTVTPEKVLKGELFHANNGNILYGTYEPLELPEGNTIYYYDGDLSRKHTSLSDTNYFNNKCYYIGKNVINTHNLFSNSNFFNSKVIFDREMSPDDNHDFNNMFFGCKNFNQSVNIPSVKNNKYINCNGMFYGCEMLNQPIIIGNGNIICSGMFYGCKNFNQSVTLGEFTDCILMFNYCTNFNQPIIIKDNTIRCYGMFKSCYNFNQSVTIGNNVISCEDMFWACNNFNQPIVMPDSVINAINMFRACNNLNQPITISNNIITCYCMFSGCRNFNQPMNIPDNIQNTYWMFQSCVSLNQPVTIGNNVVGTYMFENCYNFNSNIYIGINVNVRYLFGTYGMHGSNNREINIYIKTGDVVPNFYSMIYGMRNGSSYPSVNIYYSTFQNLNNTNSNDSIIGNTITWTEDFANNRIYNTYYKINIFNNYYV